jgi:predicted 2-oxoglutarate/Fe(II)-dependent dioxygenase YbiX
MFDISKKLGNYGLYLTNCILNIDKILSVCDTLEKNDTRIGSYVLVDQRKNLIDIWNDIDRVMKKSMLIYANTFNKNINNYIPFQDSYSITTWNVGEDIGFHTDSWIQDGITQTPSISIILYFTDNFKGGELVFPNKIHESSNLDLVIKPKAGSVAIFESNTLHRVNTLESGLRVTTGLNFMKIN